MTVFFSVTALFHSRADALLASCHLQFPRPLCYNPQMTSPSIAADTPSAAEVAPTSSAAQVAGREQYAFDFRGRAGEYFRIWIVNVLLSVVTLGIYSAWAKVRNKRYFYGNTFVGGANFEYHAKPLSILIARLIVFVGLIGAGGYLAGQDPFLVAAHSSLLLLLLPWAMVRGFAFNARNSSYRGVRFGFHRRYLPLYLIYAPLIIPFLIIYALSALSGAVEGINIHENPGQIGVPAALVALLLLALGPFLARHYHRYKAENHFLGKMSFAFDAPLGVYILALWIAPAAMLISIGVLFVVTSAVGQAATIFLFVFLYLLFLAWVLLITGKLFKNFWSGVSFARGRIICDISVLRFALGIQLVNYLAMLFTLGLATPWARVRKVKYLAAHIRIEAEPELMEEIAAAASDKTGAFGEAFADAEGFDFDVGLI
jgi:uncharacterized membrane protein YjgN (DUF898 family)